MFTTIAYVVLFAVLVAIVGFIVAWPKPSPVEPVITRREPAPLPKPKKLSWPAEQVLNNYTSLPDENKAMGDVRMVVEALDVKYNHPSVVNKHFLTPRVTDPTQKSNYQSWSHGCENDSCPMPEYFELMGAIYDIRSALRRQKSIIERKAKEDARALELAGIEPAIKDIPALMASLREEAKTVRSITADIV